MLYILLSIFCSVCVSILLKLARRYLINVQQAVTWNYSIAALLTYIIYRPNITDVYFINYQTSIYIALAFLLPSLFVIIGASIRYTGIVRTDIAQRLSLFIPVLTAFLIFSEDISAIKLTGIIIGFAAIIFTIPWNKTNGQKGPIGFTWVYPLTVFVGMGIIDVLFKQIAQYNAIPYTTSLFFVFVLAFIVSGLYLIYRSVTGKLRFAWINVLCGWILGVFNFGNILFYLKAHRAIADNPSIVFSAMNIGVIILGALTGVFIFKEKLSVLNKAGLALAILAVLIIAHS